jgi:hypothetical protein
MPQVGSVKEAFDFMGERFNADKAAGVSGSVLLDLTGEGGGKWAIKISDG